jgi:two-component system nitrogen regulation response regulator GlnG
MTATNEYGTILIVDDEKNICTLLSRLLSREGLETIEAYEGDTAQKMIVSQKPDVVLVDFRMPGMNGMELLERAKEFDQDLPVVMITAYADIKGAVEAMRAGAHDYLAKPFENLEVIRVVYRALQERKLKRKLSDLTSELQGNVSLSTSMGTSDAVYQLLCKATQVAKSDFSVLIQGETGSGKELVAQAIHDASPRSKKLFVPVDCGAIPETLLESELFGHEKGSFTGADYSKPGKFEAAKGGTLFLDEISNMPLSSQAKLLRVLQEKRVYRVGSTKPIAVDVRLLVASNKELFSLIDSGSFRSDLFFRLNEFTITVPPLRERKEDIPYLAKRFLNITNIELNKHVKGFSESAMETLLGYDWPGNVRELRSTIRRAVLLANDIVTEEHFDLKSIASWSVSLPLNLQDLSLGSLSLKEIVRTNTFTLEREVLEKALQYTGGNKAKASRLLKIDYKTIHTKIKQLGISINGGVYE